MKIEANEKVLEIINKGSSDCYEAFMKTLMEHCNKIPDGDIQNCLALNIVVNGISRLLANSALAMPKDQRSKGMDEIIHEMISYSRELVDKVDEKIAENGNI